MDNLNAGCPPTVPISFKVTSAQERSRAEVQQRLKDAVTPEDCGYITFIVHPALLHKVIGEAGALNEACFQMDLKLLNAEIYIIAELFNGAPENGMPLAGAVILVEKIDGLAQRFLQVYAGLPESFSEKPSGKFPDVFFLFEEETQAHIAAIDWSVFMGVELPWEGRPVNKAVLETANGEIQFFTTQGPEDDEPIPAA